MTRAARVAKTLRLVLVWLVYGVLVAVFLSYLSDTGFWTDSGINAISQLVSHKNTNASATRRVPNLWERPTTVTFKITKDTKIQIINGGTQRYDRSGNLWKENDPPLREDASWRNIEIDDVVVVMIDDYLKLKAVDVYIERLVGFHAGEESQPENAVGGPGWANNVTFSGWVVSVTPSEITVRYP